MAEKKDAIEKAKVVEITKGPAITKEELARMFKEQMDATIQACRKELDESNKLILAGVEPGGGGGFSNKIIEGDSGVTVNDNGTGTINISADGDHLVQFKTQEILDKTIQML